MQGITYNAFKDDEYAYELIKAYYIDVKVFKAKSSHLICIVYELWNGYMNTYKQKLLILVKLWKHYD